ncbi:MAG: hypothetical protein ACC645_05030, partial [Pirellulales bacterium]
TGAFQFVRARNSFAQTPLWPDLSQYSNVVVETTRWSAGLDYLLRRGMSCYVRYQYFDYSDETESFNSGTANMLLGGIDAVF